MTRKPSANLSAPVPVLSMAYMRVALRARRGQIKLDTLPQYLGDVYSPQVRMRVFRK